MGGSPRASILILLAYDPVEAPAKPTMLSYFREGQRPSILAELQNKDRNQTARYITHLINWIIRGVDPANVWGWSGWGCWWWCLIDKMLLANVSLGWRRELCHSPPQLNHLKCRPQECSGLATMRGRF